MDGARQGLLQAKQAKGQWSPMIRRPLHDSLDSWGAVGAGRASRLCDEKVLRTPSSSQYKPPGIYLDGSQGSGEHRRGWLFSGIDDDCQSRVTGQFPVGWNKRQSKERNTAHSEKGGRLSGAEGRCGIPSLISE